MLYLESYLDLRFATMQIYYNVLLDDIRKMDNFLSNNLTSSLSVSMYKNITLYSIFFSVIRIIAESAIHRYLKSNFDWIQMFLKRYCFNLSVFFSISSVSGRNDFMNRYAAVLYMQSMAKMNDLR